MLLNFKLSYKYLAGVKVTKITKNTRRTQSKVSRTCAFIFLMLMATSVFSQQQNKDTLFALREFARLRQMYEHLPVQINIHIQNSATPFTTPRDTLESEINIYLGKPEFYMEAEGLEEIVNDSLVVMVNNPAKEILLYPNDQNAMKKFQESLSVILPDSSLKTLAEKYTSFFQDSNSSIRKLVLNSRETLYQTNKPKEKIAITYQKSSYQPIEMSQTRLRLLPVDSAVYASFVSEKMYDGKLLSALIGKAHLFCLIKELTTTYRFNKINYDIHNPPAKQEDRITRSEDGSYIPAKGYEDYQVSKEF